MDELIKENEFLVLVAQYKRTILKLCYVYAVDSEHHNDLFQETVLNLWRSYDSFRSECGIQTWIYRITLNTCISFLRKYKRHPKTELLVQIPDIADTEEDDALIELYQMIEQLNGLDKALVLLYLEEKSYDEMAEIVGMTRSNVGVRISRIKEKLRQIYLKNKKSIKH